MPAVEYLDVPTEPGWWFRCYWWRQDDCTYDWTYDPVYLVERVKGKLSFGDIVEWQLFTTDKDPDIQWVRISEPPAPMENTNGN